MSELKNVYEEQKKNEGKSQSLKSCFTKEGLFSWKGRRNRKNFLVMKFTYFLFFGIVGFLFSITSYVHNIILLRIALGVLCCVGLLINYVNFVNETKRFHDLGKSTVFSLFITIFDSVWRLHVIMYGDGNNTFASFFRTSPFVSLIVMICFFVFVYYCFGLYFFRGTVGYNEYGKDPLTE